MENNLRKLAIEAIKAGDIGKLKAYKILANQGGNISTYYQVVGHEQVYNTYGQKVELEPAEEMESIPGILPIVTGVIICFSTFEEMEKVFAIDAPAEPFLRK